MEKKIEKTSDNYVKSEGLKAQDQIGNNRGSHMIIKLAYYNEKRQEEEIRECCEVNGSTFIPLVENKFGILNERPSGIECGEESSNVSELFGIKEFIDIYKCVEKKELDRKKYSFWKKNVDPYIGELLDNQFFFNIFNFVKNQVQNATGINFLNYIAEYKSVHELDNIEDIETQFSKKEEIVIKKISLRIQNEDMVINKNGYVDICCSNSDYFRSNEDLIKKILIIGFKGDHG